MFIYSDSGRSQSKRPKQSNDCTVRAFASAFNLSYDYAYDYLKELGRGCSKGFHLQVYLKQKVELFDFSIDYTVFQAQKGKPRVKVKDIGKMYPTGTHIIRIAGHVACMHNGIIHDTTGGYGDKAVYCMFSVARNAPKQEPVTVKTARKKLIVHPL